MAKLAAWTVDRQHAENDAQQPEPKRVDRSQIGLERNLEDWIANDVTLIAEGLTLVGRQISIDDGRLDLLAIDTQDRWVVIEIKPAVLDSGALAQALYYAASIARLSADEFYRKLEPGLGDFGEVEELSARVKRQLANEEEGREIAVLLVGAGIHPGLERMNEFLGRFGVPIGVVSFEVFGLDDGPQLLIREVIDEPTVPPPPPRRLTIDAIRRRAVDVGMGRQFDRFVNIAEAAGLAVQPQRASVRIAPPTNRTRYLMYAQPRSGEGGGEMLIHVGPKYFAEFFPHVDEREAVDALGKLDGACVGGEALDNLLDRIERFLIDKVCQTDASGE
ncbi:MAG: endonuclease NucS [Rhodospirillaceae bacterium]|nr:endonuclease NucS [Rhodospirillaceae bacterium]